MIFSRIASGGHFDGVSALDRRPPAANFVALTNVRVGKIPSQCIERLLETSPAFSRALMREAADAARDLAQRLFERSIETVPTRVQLELLRLAREAGVRNNRAAVPAVPTHAERVTVQIRPAASIRPGIVLRE